MEKFPRSPLLTDFYELTMLAGYLEEGMQDQPAVFDLFFRESPFQGSYAVFAGLEPALRYLEQLRFGSADLAYLAGMRLFSPSFIDYLGRFRFRGRVTAPPEGTVVFGHEPLLTVEGSLAEAQLVETALLNIINFQTLVATKAARLTIAAGDAAVIDFGLRRAQGPDGGVSAARAARIGGAQGTSNVIAGRLFDLPVRGTHAHSWVMSFPDEISAFRAYADCFPDSCILLVDTYDTLRSGLPNALTVARELRERGHELQGIRLDSGDIAYLSREARRLFDAAGFPGVKIVASNELDEYVIQSVRNEGGKVDIYGVGTRLVTAAGAGGGALGGVYKLVRLGEAPKLKITSDISKATLPDRKRLLRLVDAEGIFLQDLLALEGEDPQAGEMVFDPANPAHHRPLPAGAGLEEIRRVVMSEGKITMPFPSLEASASLCAEQLRRLPSGCLRFFNPHRYKVSMTRGLHDLRSRLIAELEKKYRQF